MQLILLLALLALLALPLSANAAPSISSVSLSAGLSVSGTDFGSKPSAAPIRYEEFEFGASGDKVSVGGYWETRADKPEMQISTDQSRGGGTRSAKVVLTAESGVTTRADKAWKNGVGFATTGKIYLNYWIYWDWGWATADSDDVYQIKTLNLGDYDDGAADMYPSLYMMGWQNYKYQAEPENPNVYGYTYWHYNPNSSATAVDPHGNATIRHAPDFDNQHNTIGRTPGWYNFVAQVDLGTPGSSNASAKFWVISPLGNPYSFGSVSDVKMVSSTSGYHDAVRLGWFMGSTPDGSVTIYYDDIYMDNSFARVEIGDNSDYNSCSIREVQIPTTWSSESIAATINYGNFSPGETAYVFVVDPLGNPSTGYEITLPSLATFSGASGSWSTQ